MGAFMIGDASKGAEQNGIRSDDDGFGGKRRSPTSK
jgi:hypothetical protein